MSAAISKKTPVSKKTARVGKKSTGSSFAKKKSGKRTAARATPSVRFVVAPKSNGWMVRRVGSDRIRVFDTQADAVAAATKTARNSHSEVVIKRKDGTIRDKVSTSAVDAAMLQVWKFTHRGNSIAKKR